MQQYIATLLDGKGLSQEQAHDAMSTIMAGDATEAQIAGFLVALRAKGETVDEITGCALAMREAATHVDVGDLDVVDTCGTGGTHKGIFNVSTASALVAAGAGVPIAKHGNRGASSSFGSADVLQALGVNIEAEPSVVERCIREVGIGFLFAPLMHKAMKFAIGPRRQLGVRTVFNILGPLTNPAGARRQVLGVFDEKLVQPIAGVLKNLGASRALVVHSADGMDEISPCAETTAAFLDDGGIDVRTLAPGAFGIDPVPRADLAASSAEESAGIIRAVLGGEAGAPRTMVLLNAGAAIYVGGRAGDVEEGIQLARESIDSGSAGRTLERFVAAASSAG
jgi:anthranilate phosphoribosyltransferase